MTTPFDMSGPVDLDNLGPVDDLTGRMATEIRHLRGVVAEQTAALRALADAIVPHALGELGHYLVPVGSEVAALVAVATAAREQQADSFAQMVALVRVEAEKRAAAVEEIKQRKLAELTEASVWTTWARGALAEDDAELELDLDNRTPEQLREAIGVAAATLASEAAEAKRELEEANRRIGEVVAERAQLRQRLVEIAPAEVEAIAAAAKRDLPEYYDHARNCWAILAMEFGTIVRRSLLPDGRLPANIERSVNVCRLALRGLEALTAAMTPEEVGPVHASRDPQIIRVNEPRFWQGPVLAMATLYGRKDTGSANSPPGHADQAFPGAADGRMRRAVLRELDIGQPPQPAEDDRPPEDWFGGTEGS